MKKYLRWAVPALALAATIAGSALTAAKADDLIVGVSWSNFQEERWKTDEAAIKAGVGEGRCEVHQRRRPERPHQAAQRRAEPDCRRRQGLDHPGAGRQGHRARHHRGYDRLIENPGAYYLTFDNKEVGRMQADYVFKAQPKGNYVFIKGCQCDPNADFLHEGQLEVLKAAIDKGDIKVVGEQYTDAWKPENAQKNMEQILTQNDNKVDAVVASNDGTAGGVVAALTAQGLQGIPVSGQDGDHAALNRVALGTQTVSVWKDARELGKAAGEIAVQLAKGTKLGDIPGTVQFKSPGGNTMNTTFLKPVAITKDNLNVVIDAGWIKKEEVCQGVAAGKVAVCN